MEYWGTSIPSRQCILSFELDKNLGAHDACLWRHCYLKRTNWHACSRSILLDYNTTTICVGYMSPNIPAKVFRKFFIVSSSSVEVVRSDPPPIENWGGWFCDAGLKVNNEADNFGHFATFHIPSFLLCGIFINIVYVYRKKDSK